MIIKFEVVCKGDDRMAKYTITDQFPGGNITVDSICENHVFLSINNRDSKPWFYWAFKVCGAAGRTLTFEFGKDLVGYFGPAVSYDLKNWHWSELERYRADEKERFSFTYTFSEEEDSVYFAHNMLYNTDVFENVDFMEKSTLCIDSDGSSVPLAAMGEGENVILLTARHHACEAPANYVLEGVLREFHDKLPENYRVLAVPFVDMAGVVAGDQGKGRIPHDHNRDYVDGSIYPTVRAMKELLARENVKYVFDFHDPCHIGGGNDYTRLVNAYESMRDDMNLLSKLYEGEVKVEITKQCFDFQDGRNTWRDKPLEGTFSAYCGAMENVDFVATIEMPYFGEQGNVMTQASYLATGRAFGRAIRKFIETRK